MNRFTLIAALLLVSMPSSADRFDLGTFRQIYDSGEEGKRLAVMYVGGLANMYHVAQFARFGDKEQRGFINQCMQKYSPTKLTHAVMGATVADDVKVANIVYSLQRTCHIELAAAALE